MVDASSPNATAESIATRNNRNLADLLQELRVAGLGVQMLFGFLLALPFTTRFTKLSAGQRDLYKGSLFFAAISTALLVAPVAYHRWVFRRHEKGKLLRFANVLAIVGLAAVAAAISLAVCLIMTVVGSGWIVTLMVGFVSLSFVVLWFVVPITERLTSNPASFD